jgi:hypothetical protein
MDSQTTTIAIVATIAAVGIATAAYFYLSDDGKKSDTKQATSAAGQALKSPQPAQFAAGAKSACDKQTFLAVFRDILRELELALLQIMQAAQTQQQMSKQPMPEEQMSRTMMLQVQTAIQQITDKVHSAHGVTEKMVETFANDSQSDPDVSEQIQKLQTMIQNPTASLPCELPSDMTQGRMLEIFEKILEITSEVVEDKVAQARAAGKDVKSEVTQYEIHQAVQIEVDDKKKAVHNEYGLEGHAHRPEVILHSALMTYSADVSFGKKMEQMNLKQQQRMMKAFEGN